MNPVRLLAISSVIGDKGRIKPGQPFTVNDPAEAEVLIGRGVAMIDPNPVNVSDPGAGGAVVAAALAQEIAAGQVFDMPGQTIADALGNAEPLTTVSTPATLIPGAVPTPGTLTAQNVVDATIASARADLAGSADIGQIATSAAANDGQADGTADGVVIGGDVGALPDPAAPTAPAVVETETAPAGKAGKNAGRVGK